MLEFQLIALSARPLVPCNVQRGTSRHAPPRADIAEIARRLRAGVQFKA